MKLSRARNSSNPRLEQIPALADRHEIEVSHPATPLLLMLLSAWLMNAACIFSRPTTLSIFAN